MLANLLLKEPKTNLTLISGKSKKFPEVFVGTNCNSPIGKCFIAWTISDNSNVLICFLAFTENPNNLITSQSDLKKLLPDACFKEDHKEAVKLISKIFAKEDKTQIQLLIKGTEFQEKIWHALTEIGFGKVICYEELAERIGNKNSTRAVASAVARNNISYLIPCHRVIRKSGEINKYRWGLETKKKLLDWETKALQ